METKTYDEKQLESLNKLKKKLILELDTYEYESRKYMDCEEKISEIEKQIEMMYEDKNTSEVKAISRVERKGTRTNPYRAGDTAELDEELEMTIEFIARGERAYRVLKKKEPNIEKPENMEYIYMSATMKNIGNSRVIITGSAFSVVKDNGVESEELVYMGEHFKPMHAGAVQKANIHFKIDKSERNPMLFYDDFREGSWIDLNVYETEELLNEDEEIIKNEQQNDMKMETKENVVNSEYADACKSGMEAYNRGEVEKAKEMLKKAALSGDLRAYEILGDIHMNNKNFDAAIICFEKAKLGGIETATYKLKTAKEEKEKEEFFKKGMEYLNSKKKQAKVETQNTSGNKERQSAEGDSKPINNQEKENTNVSYNLEENKRQAKKKIMFYIGGVVMCGVFAAAGFGQSNFSMVIVFGLAMLWIGKNGIEAYQSRCPQCEKLNAMVIVSSVKTGENNINKLMRVNDYDKRGYKIGEHDQWVSGTRTFTHDVDQCKYCKYKRTVNRSHDSV